MDTYENKYKEALERAKKLQETCDSTAVVGWCEYLFPELKEDIRHFLVDFIKVCRWSEKEDQGWPSREECIAWLEKQGQKTHQTPQWMIDFLDKNRSKFASLMGDYDEQREAEGKLLAIIGWLEKQGEQKPTDKVEPKFKIKYAGREYNVLEIKENMGITWYGIEDEPNHIDYVKANSCEIINVYGIKENGSPYPTKPAIFAGYKPTDEAMKEALHTEYEKGRADAFAEMQKEWSEEDEKEYKYVLKFIDNILNNCDNDKDYEHCKRCYDFLESLKERYTWKPSDEQMEALEQFISEYKDIDDSNRAYPISHIIESLYNDLKKLKGE